MTNYIVGEMLEFHSDETNQVLECKVLSVQRDEVFVLFPAYGSQHRYAKNDPRLRKADSRLEPFERYMAGRK